LLHTFRKQRARPKERLQNVPCRRVTGIIILEREKLDPDRKNLEKKGARKKKRSHQKDYYGERNHMFLETMTAPEKTVGCDNSRTYSREKGMPRKSE